MMSWDAVSWSVHSTGAEEEEDDYDCGGDEIAVESRRGWDRDCPPGLWPGREVLRPPHKENFYHVTPPLCPAHSLPV